jgi:hypothetical protein
MDHTGQGLFHTIQETLIGLVVVFFVSLRFHHPKRSLVGDRENRSDHQPDQSLF